MNGYSEITVGTSELLVPGDRVSITWKIYQGGTWLVNYQATLIGEVLELDKRVKFLGHSYDPKAMTFGIEVEVLGDSATVEGIVDVAMGATWAFAYEAGRRHQVYRLAAPEPEPAAILAAAQPGAPVSGPGLGIVLALAVVGLLLIGD